MSIVAHQYNILSEQLRKGIGGLNEGKKQANEQILKMEQLKYGIEKDRRVQERAERGMKIQEAQNIRAQERFDYEEAGLKHAQVQATEKFKRDNEMRMTELTPDLVRRDVDPLGTMDDKVFQGAYDAAVKASGAENMYQAANSPLFMMHMMTATDAGHRERSIARLEDEIKTVENPAHETELNQNIESLKAAKTDPLGTAQKKLDILNNLYAKVTDPQQQKKAEFLIKQQQDKVENLRATAAATIKNQRIVKTWGEPNPYTGEAESIEHAVPRGQAFMPPKGRTLDKPKTKMKVIDVGNKPKLDSMKLKAERAFAWAETAGGMSELEYKNLLSSGALPEEIKAYGKVSNIDQLLSIINEQKIEIDKAIVLNGMGLDNKAVYGWAQAMGITYEEAFEWLAANPQNIREH